MTATMEARFNKAVCAVYQSSAWEYKVGSGWPASGGSRDTSQEKVVLGDKWSMGTCRARGDAARVAAI